MDEDKNIDNKINEIFNGLNKPLPSDLWDKLSEKITTKNSTESIEDKIKDSFENSDKALPTHIWETVNKNLNIDKVWIKINEELDKRRIFYWRSIAIVALLLLILFTGGIYLHLKNESKLTYNQKHQNNHQNNKQYTIANNEPNINLQLNKNSSKTYIVAERKGSNNVTTTKEVIKTTSELKEKQHSATILRLSSATNPSQVSITSNEPIATLQLNNSVEELERFSVGELIKSLTQQISNSTTEITLQLNNIRDTELVFNQSNYCNLQDTSRKINTLSIKRKKIEIGITYSYNNTWLLNNDTRKSFDENSLIQTKAVFASSYGLVANYNFSKNSAVSTEIYINSKSRQQYNEFTEGKYTLHTIESNYLKFTLLYQLNFNQSYRKKIPSKYTVRVGFYGAYLKNHANTYSKIIVSETSNYTSNDYGFKLAIGQEKKLKNIIVGYGINGEYGLKNIFGGNNQIPKDFNVTKNALIGAYLSVKYNF